MLVIKKSFRIYIFIWFVLLSFFGIYQNMSYALEPAGNTIYQGIDVSAYQGNINYIKVKDNDIDVVYIKSSEGDYLVDPEFRNNYEQAKLNGLNIGFYHFLRARNNEEAIREAEFFSNVISGTEPNCRLAMDFEVFGNLSVDEINSISRAFLEKVKELTNKELVIYSNSYDAINIFGEELAKDYPLWVAQYGVREPSNNGKWNNWIGFQYSDEGKVSGVNGSVDLDRFTEDIFLTNQQEIPKPNNPSPEEIQNVIYYTIKRGDTLTRNC